MLAEINDEERALSKPGPPTNYIRAEHFKHGRLQTPTGNDITARNAICNELAGTPLGTISQGADKRECFGKGGLHKDIMNSILDYIYG